MAGIPDSKLAEVVDIVGQIKRLDETDQLSAYDPYSYQRNFHSARDMEGDLSFQRALMAANKIGKTACGALEMACHTTGHYPDWWDGHRTTKPVQAWAGGETNELTRDLVQLELLGEPGDREAYGTGAIPLEFLPEWKKSNQYPEGARRKSGVPLALDMIPVKHKSGGWSRIEFKGYDAGKTKWMGKAKDVIWLDEEPPIDIYNQCLRAMLLGGFLYMTFTPEHGVSAVVVKFMNELKPGMALYQAGWDDARHSDGRTHLTPTVKKQIYDAMSPHERDMRSKGIPVLGSGLVFPVSQESISTPHFDIPPHWPRICGIDFGFDHPAAGAWLALDRSTDTVYVYDCYRLAGAVPAIHASAIKSRGQWIPVAWPHDGSVREKGSGDALAELYRDEGVNMLGGHFENPEGGNSVEPGIMVMLQRMQTGRFKVFENQLDWFQECRTYHRKDGQIIKVGEDIMSATRYACQSLRYASETERPALPTTAEGMGEGYDPYQERRT